FQKESTIQWMRRQNASRFVRLHTYILRGPMTRLLLTMLVLVGSATVSHSADFPAKLEWYFGMTDEELTSLVAQPEGLARVMDGLINTIRSEQTSPSDQAILWTLAVDLYQAL